VSGLLPLLGGNGVKGLGRCVECWRSAPAKNEEKKGNRIPGRFFQNGEEKPEITTMKRRGKCCRRYPQINTLEMGGERTRKKAITGVDNGLLGRD